MLKNILAGDYLLLTVPLITISCRHATHFIIADYLCVILQYYIISFKVQTAHLNTLILTEAWISLNVSDQMLLQKLITSSALVEDPSPVASTSRSLILGETDGLLSYKATSRLIALSNCHFSNWDIDSHLLFLLKVCWLSMLNWCELIIKIVFSMIYEFFLLKIIVSALFFFVYISRLLIVQCKISSQERGFLPLSAALLSSSTLRSEVGHARALFMDITSYISSIILSLVCCRSGLFNDILCRCQKKLTFTIFADMPISFSFSLIIVLTR